MGNTLSEIDCLRNTLAKQGVVLNLSKELHIMMWGSPRNVVTCAPCVKKCDLAQKRQLDACHKDIVDVPNNVELKAAFG